MRLVYAAVRFSDCNTTEPQPDRQPTTLEYLERFYPPILGVAQVSEITTDAVSTIRNKVSQGLYPIPSFTSGRKRLFRLIDIAAHLDRIYAACQAKVPQAKRRGRPTKAEQLRRQLLHHDNADTAALHGSQPDDAPAPSRTASGPGGSRQRGASSAAETAGRPSGRQRSGGAARPAEAQRGHPADRSTVQGESCGSATQQEASGQAEPADASQRSLRSRVAALCAAGPARKAADGASSPVNEDARPSGARRARPRGATDAQVASPPEPIPDFVPLIVTNENEVTYED